jgi:predicted acyl esterase
LCRSAGRFRRERPIHRRNAAPAAEVPRLPERNPAKFTPTTDGHDYIRRIAEIPMRDGVKLHTVILVPKGARHEGILLTRTPYDADGLTAKTHSGHLGPSLQGYDNATDVIVEDGYIRVVQDVRGKYGSEGDYVMNRPVHGPQNRARSTTPPIATTPSTGW